MNGEGVAYAKPYILDKSIPKDEGVLKVMAPFEQKLERFKKVVGSTKVFLTRDGRRECLVGNFVADAFRKVNNKHKQIADFGYQNVSKLHYSIHGMISKSV